MVFLNTALLADLLSPCVLDYGLQFTVLERTDSTNRQLVAAPFQATAARPTLLIAREQTAGRGRRGRRWIAESGRALCLSLAIEEPAGYRDPGGLSLAAGVAIARGLEPLVAKIALKWPNDLIRNGRKCGGILIEARRQSAPVAIDRLVVGVGLNLLAPEDIDGAIGQPADGLFDDASQAQAAGEIVAATVARAVLEASRAHAREGLAAFFADWERLDAYRGREVVLRDSGTIVAQGRVSGIDTNGGLILETPTGDQVVLTGDLSLRTTDQAV